MRPVRLLWVGLGALGLLVGLDAGCTAALGIDKDYQPCEGGCGTGGSSSGTSTGTSTGTDTGTATGTNTGTATGTNRPDGTPCADNDECEHDHCVDNVCCDDDCPERCRGCAQALTGEPDGTCAPVTAGTDPNGDCETDQVCDGEAHCIRAPGAECDHNDQCLSDTCFHHVCCTEACEGRCMSCDAEVTGQAGGVCAAVPSGDDPYDECSDGDCDGSGDCTEQ